MSKQVSKNDKAKAQEFCKKAYEYAKPYYKLALNSDKVEFSEIQVDNKTISICKEYYQPSFPGESKPSVKNLENNEMIFNLSIIDNELNNVVANISFTPCEDINKNDGFNNLFFFSNPKPIKEHWLQSIMINDSDLYGTMNSHLFDGTIKCVKILDKENENNDIYRIFEIEHNKFDEWIYSEEHGHIYDGNNIYREIISPTQKILDMSRKVFVRQNTNKEKLL